METVKTWVFNTLYPFPQDCGLKWAKLFYMETVKTQKSPPLTNQSNYTFDELKSINKPCLLCSDLLLWGVAALSQTTVTWTSEPPHLQNYCQVLAGAFEAGHSFIWLNTHMDLKFSTLLQRCGNFSLGTSSDLLFPPPPKKKKTDFLPGYATLTAHAPPVNLL